MAVAVTLTAIETLPLKKRFGGGRIPLRRLVCGHRGQMLIDGPFLHGHWHNRH